MDAKTCLKKLELVGVLEFATVDKDNKPQLRCISAIHFEENSFWFLTARGKEFYHQLTDGSPYKIDQNHCLQCGRCFENCPVQAIEMAE